MVWWIAAKLLKPFAAGAIGSLVRLLIVLAIVVIGSYALFDVNLVQIAFDVGVALVDMIIDAVADRVVDSVSP
jgi:hypothetical protein